MNFIFTFLIASTVTFTCYSEEQATTSKNWAFMAGTELPLGIDSNIQYTWPTYSVYSKAKLGLLLENYLDVMNDMAEEYDYYNSATGKIVTETFSNQAYYEILLGLNPSAFPGWFFEFGYLYTEGSGQVLASVLFEAVSGISLPSGGNTYDIKANFTAINLRMGFKKEFGDQQQAYISLGLMKPTKLEADLDRNTSGPLQEAILQNANRRLDEYLDESFSDALIPTLAIGWIYKF